MSGFTVYHPLESRGGGKMTGGSAERPGEPTGSPLGATALPDAPSKASTLSETKAALEGGPAGTLPAVEWLDFDFERPVPPPDYLVDAAIERGDVVLMTSDTGVGKSWLGADLAVAVVEGRDWLDRNVEQGRVVVLDNENSPRHVEERLRALGLSTAGAEQMHYASRQGIDFASDGWWKWLDMTLGEHNPDLVVCDTLMALGAVGDINDNTEAVDFMTRVRQRATEYRTVFLLQHHVRKQSGVRDDTGQSAMGARQLVGQADVHIALSKPSSEPIESNDDARTDRIYATATMPKRRNGAKAEPERITVEMNSNADGVLDRAVVQCLGPPEQAPTATERLTEQIVKTLQEWGEPMRSGEIAEALDMQPTGGTWDRALKAALADGRIEKIKFGIYQATDSDHPEL